MKRKLSQKNVDTVPSIEDIETPAAVVLASMEIRKFLRDLITKKETDVIISTRRKGSWIIDDTLKTSDLEIKHYTNDDIQNIPPLNIVGKNVLIFDDSIHKGKSTLNILSKIKGYKDVRVACITTNDEALERIEKKKVKVEFLEKFKEYAAYDGKSKELIPGCQTYYYTFFMIPYISSLSVNYSPDYKSLFVEVRGGSSKTLESMTESVIDAIGGADGDDLYEVDNTMYTRRVSLRIGEEYLERYLSDIGVPYEMDISKLRISVSVYKSHSEIVVTPMLCPICDDVADVDMQNLPFYLSGRFIAENREKIIDTIKNKGFDIVREYVRTGTSEDNE